MRFLSLSSILDWNDTIYTPFLFFNIGKTGILDIKTQKEMPEFAHTFRHFASLYQINSRLYVGGGR